MIGKIRSPCCYDAQTSRRSLFSSLFFWTRGGHAECYLHSSSLFVWGFKYQPFQCPLVGVWGFFVVVVFLSLHTNLWKMFLFDVPFLFIYFFFIFFFWLFVQCLTPNQPQNNKWPKSCHGVKTKKGSGPFMYRTMHKKQLNLSVRLLNSAGGVYFVIAAVPMSL